MAWVHDTGADLPYAPLASDMVCTNRERNAAACALSAWNC